MTDPAVVKRLRDLMNTAVGQSDWNSLEEHWLQALESAPDAGDLFVGVAERALSRGERKRTGEMVMLAAPVLKAHECWKDLLALCRLAAKICHQEPELPALTHEAFAQACGHLPQLSAALAVADVRVEGHFLDHLALLEDLLSFAPGDCLRHGSWGVGFVTRVEPSQGALYLDFDDKTDHRFALEMAKKALVRLDGKGFEAMARREHEALSAMALEAPEELMRRMLLDRGRVDDEGRYLATRDIKAALEPHRLPPGDWTSWWKKARAVLGKNPWFELGRGANARVLLRARPKSLIDEMRERFERAPIFEDALRIARELIEQNREAKGRREDLDFLERFFAARLEAGPGRRPHEALETAAFLDLHFERAMDERAEALLAITGAHPIEALLQPMTHLDLQCRVCEFLKRHDADWVKRWVAMFDIGGEALWDFLARGLFDAGQEEALRDLDLALRHDWDTRPAQYLWWARAFFNGNRVVARGADPAVRVFENLFRNLTALDRRRKSRSDEEAQRLVQEYRALIGTKRGALVKTFVEEARRDDRDEDIEVLEALVSACPALSDIMLANLRRYLPRRRLGIHELQRPEVADDSLYCTAAAYRRKMEELRDLKENLLPEAEHGIGVAQSHGDLSENAEWEAAIEHRANLDRRRQELERQLATAQILHLDAVPTDRAGVGTRVHVRNGALGVEERYTILGPFEADHERHILSHKAPLARGLLGREVGEHFEIALPTGAVTFELLAIEALAEPTNGDASLH